MAVRKEAVWAVGFKSCVEFRRCSRAPRAITSEFEKDSETRVPRYVENQETGKVTVKWDVVPRKIHISNTIHTGGKVLGTMDLHKFWRMTNLPLRVGETIKLTKIQATKVLGTPQ